MRNSDIMLIQNRNGINKFIEVFSHRDVTNTSINKLLTSQEYSFFIDKARKIF